MMQSFALRARFIFKQYACLATAACLFVTGGAANGATGILPVNPSTGIAASGFTPSVSPAQFNQAASALTEFTTQKPNFNMFDVSNVLQEQGLNPTQMIEVAAQSSISPQQLGQLGKAMNLQGIGTEQITAGMQNISTQFPDMSIGAMGEMVNLGAITGGQFGQFAEGAILQASSLQDVVGQVGAIPGQLTAQAEQTVQAVTGQIEGMTTAAAAEVMGAMQNVGDNIMSAVQNAIPADLLSGIGNLTGGLNNLVGNINLPGFGGGFGGLGGGGGSSGNYDNAQRNKQQVRSSNGGGGVRGTGSGNTPMSMRATAKMDLSNMTPYVHKTIMGCGDNDPRKFYDGPAATFGRNHEYYNNKMVGYDNPEEIRKVSSSTTTSASGPHSRIKGCETRLEPKGGVPNGNYNELSAEFHQKQAQHCANEYLVLNSPYVAENNNPKQHTLDASKDCQPLKMIPPQEEEFDLGTYYGSCWKKLLNDPSHKLRTGADAAAGEPSYGDDVTIVNANHESVKAPGSFPNMKGALLARNPQEEITYPCHPFGMRWDFSYNERDEYSPKTASYNGENTAVRCSGSLEKEIKVDVLTPRKELFDKRVMKRIDFNDQCRKDSGAMNVCCKPGAFKCIVRPCWECFGNPKPDNPPCATRYDGKDLSVVIPKFVPKGQYTSRKNPQPWCGKVHAEKMCQDVAKNVLMLNKLKLRHYDDVTGDPNAAGDEEDKLFNAGMKFPDHFENRRPYMRFWDLGTAYEESPIPTRQQLAQDEGAYVGIVGVGREKPPGQEFDERAMVANSSNDPISGGWAALKAYQADTMQKTGMSCLANYNAIYKPLAPEEQTLRQAGGTELQVLDEAADGSVRPVAQNVSWLPSHRGVVGDNSAESDKPRDERERQFPHFNDEGEVKGLTTGLDNAKVGQVLLLPKGGSGNPGKPGCPTQAVINEVTNKYVRVTYYNAGKNPDASCKLDGLGTGPERYFYKPGAKMDPVVMSELRQCDLPDGWTHSCSDVNSDSCVLDCEDTNLKKCTFKAWGEAELYDPRADYREGEGGDTGV